jgi:hypothetical protein
LANLLKRVKLNSSETGNLLNKVAKSANWWRRFFESNDLGEIDQIISELSPLDLASLDQRTRGYVSYSYYTFQNWQKLGPSDIRKLAGSKFATSLVGLASFHSNGHIREKAVAELASQHTGRELPFLLIRLNDWVPQVHEAAAEAVRARIKPAYAVYLLANIALVLRLRICGRVDKKFVDDICGLLKSSNCKEVLWAGMKSKDKTVRRMSFQLAAEAEPSSRAAIIRAVMADPDAMARSWAIRQFLPEVTPDELPGVIEPMLKDRFMPVRRDALWFAATKRPDIAKMAVRDALLDSHISMRETARQFLNVAEINSTRDFYADALEKAGDTQQYSAICGLGETGKVADVPLVASFLDSNLTKLRRAAVYAIGRLDLEGQLQQLFRILPDARPSVSREVLKALQPKAAFLPLDDLEALLAYSTVFHVRRNALTLIQHNGKWKKVPAILTACTDKDPRIAEQAVEALRTWRLNYNSSYAEPTHEDFQRISSALDQVQSCLPHGFDVELRACLKIYFR